MRVFRCQRGTSSTVITFAVALFLLLVVFFSYLLIAKWGKNQAFLPEILKRKVRLGQSYEAFSAAIGSISNPRYLHLNRDEYGYFVSLSEPGVGSLFVPQYEITIGFDAQMNVTGAKVSICYRTDEEFLDFQLER